MASDGWWEGTAVSKAIDLTDFQGRELYEVIYALHRHYISTDGHFELGSDAFIGDETIRFVASQHLGFAANEVTVRPEKSGEGLTLEVSSFGLTGVAGVLPQHYTELILQRMKRKDYALRDFLDLFNHRLISLYYRSWEKYQYSVHHQRHLWGQPTDIHQALQSLTGSIDDSDIYWGGLLAKTVRNVASMKAIISHTLKCDVDVDEFVGRWIPLQGNEQTALCSRAEPDGLHAQLGRTTILGKQVWNVNAAIRIVLYVQDAQLTRRLIQKSVLMTRLNNLARHFVPQSTQVDWEVQTYYADLPLAALGSETQLGLSAMLGMSSLLATKPVKISIN